MPDHAQKAWASSHETYVTGRSSSRAAPGHETGGRRPAAAAKARYWAFVTGVRLN